MFGFESLEAYQKAKSLSLKIRAVIAKLNLDRITEDQLRRASLSIVLNLAEGAGRFSDKDTRRFYVISRSSLYECVAILEILHAEKQINLNLFNQIKDDAEILSKVIFKLIRKLSNQ